MFIKSTATDRAMDPNSVLTPNIGPMIMLRINKGMFKRSMVTPMGKFG